MPGKKYDKGGIVYYKKKGLTKSLIIHITPDAHRKLREQAFLKESSIQEVVSGYIEEGLNKTR